MAIGGEGLGDGGPVVDGALIHLFAAVAVGLAVLDGARSTCPSLHDQNAGSDYTVCHSVRVERLDESPPFCRLAFRRLALCLCGGLCSGAVTTAPVGRFAIESERFARQDQHGGYQ